MRLIGSLPSEDLAREFSYFLTKEGIANQIEAVDAPASKPGSISSQFYVWVIEEDDMLRAQQWLQQFNQDHTQPLFRGHAAAAKRALEEQAKKEEQRQHEQKAVGGPLKRLGLMKSTLTILLIIISIFVFIIGNLSKRSTLPPGGGAPQPELIASPIYQEMLYDFPHAFRLYDQLATLYSAEQLTNPGELPPEGKVLLAEALKTPYWQGFYEQVEQWVHPTPNGNLGNGPLFEKIREGELWRLFSPALLHADFFHILFNLIWLVLLGCQIESKIGFSRYFLLVLIAGIISNTAQYLMGGPIFLGLSGIVTAQFGFIWARQHKAPWEGYQLNRTTIAFILIFILGMAALQTVSFFIEISGKPSISPGIANTAHLSGMIVGAFFGRLHAFRLRHQGGK